MHRIFHIHPRELRFIALLSLTLLLIGLQLADGLRLAASGGSGWRSVDQAALERRIESGRLSDHEASWYHPSTPDEATALGRGP